MPGDGRANAGRCSEAGHVRVGWRTGGGRSHTMSTLAKAIELAVTAHAAQVEKPGNTPYVLHPLRVMQQVEGEEAKIVGVLHDVVEDTDVTPHDLERMGFSEAVVRGVLAVSRREGESYADFVVRAGADPLGRRVKLADLIDNF